jgi:DNA modification methylase
MSDFQLHLGDCLDVLPTLPAGSVQCVVTSPPYFGLRDYGTADWQGGDAECDHLQALGGTRQSGRDRAASNGKFHDAATPIEALALPYRSTCGKCGAVRKDSQIGLEPTPAAYVAKMVAVFREVRRVLRDDGTVWLNLGDSYASSTKGSGGSSAKQDSNAGSFYASRSFCHDVKDKDLLGIPWRVAFALQDDGWYLRSDIIWHKPNPMPESVKDRPTRAHEYVFLLTKQARYYYDAEAIAEPATGYDGRNDTTIKQSSKYVGGAFQFAGNGHERWKWDENGAPVRNARSVWSIATQPRPEAHFAAFPDELARRCILAGTSAKGCCAQCGAPWERFVESHIEYTQKTHTHPKYGDGGQFGVMAAARHQSGHIPGRTVKDSESWQPTCACAAEVVPCTVLDPFAGRGTTLSVAINYGRSAVGIELNPEYAKLIRSNVNQTQPALLLETA